jgi:hypothetical protein
VVRHAADVTRPPAEWASPPTTWSTMLSSVSVVRSMIAAGFPATKRLSYDKEWEVDGLLAFALPTSCQRHQQFITLEP